MTIGKKELLTTMCIVLTLVVLLGTAVVSAKPVDPTEGDEEDYHVTGDWNWGIDAYCFGHWVWFWMCRPPFIVFTEWYCSGSRWGGIGVWFTGDMKFSWDWDSGSNYVYDGGGGPVTTQTYTIHTHHIHCKTESWFANWIGQSWYAYAEAQLDI
jgi:hypothetical protein